MTFIRFLSIFMRVSFAAAAVLGTKFARSAGEFSFVDYEVPVLSFTENDSDSDVKVTLLSQDEPSLVKIRKALNFDRVLRRCSDDLSKVKRLSIFVSELWKHDGWGISKTGNPLETVWRVVKRKERFSCVEYANVLRACLVSVGIPARILDLKMSDVETRKLGAGHVVVEAYLRDMKKWIMADGQTGAIFSDKESGTPLNALEIQHEISRGKKIKVEGIMYSTREYLEFLAPYLYYFDTPLHDNVLRKFRIPKVMLVPCGAKEITHFQGDEIIHKIIFTNSKKLFYSAPNLGYQEPEFEDALCGQKRKRKELDNV